MLTPIGTYRKVVMGGSTLTWGDSPFYAKRQKYLPMVRRTMTQILVFCLGQLAWINIHPDDINPHDTD